ncbi:MAG: hypothetical protein ACYCUY_02860 [Acidithiobacillus sp.]
MFTSHDPAAAKVLENIALCLEKQIAQIDANDPELVRLKEAERDAAAKINLSLSEVEVANLVRAHDRTVWDLIDYIREVRHR